MVFVNNAITYTDYKAVYLDEASFKELSHYDTLIEDKCDIGLANNMAASGIIYLMKNSELEKYVGVNELMGSISTAATFASVPLIFVAFASSTGWTYVGIALTLAGAGSTTYCLFNNITDESLEKDLEDLLNDGNLNVCLACYDVHSNNSLSRYFDAEWNNWDGQYINRIIGNSVLNVGVNFKLYDVNNNQILDFDTIN